MQTSQPELGEAVRQAVGRWAVFWPHFILSLTVAVHTWIFPGSPAFQRYSVIPLVFVIILLGFARLFDLARIYNWHLPYLIVYHVIEFVGLAFLSDVSTPYMVLWLFVIFLSYLFYGRKGVLRSCIVFTAAVITKFIYAYYFQPHTTVELINIPAGYFATIAAVILYSNVQKVFEWEHEKLKETTARITLERGRLLSLIHTVTESVVVLNKEGKIDTYNAAFVGLVDTHEVDGGRIFDDVAHLQDEQGKKVLMKDLLAQVSTSLLRSDLRLVYGKQDYAILSLTITRVKDAHTSDNDSYIVTLRDITREKTLEEERKDFVSVISHELRTPMAVTEANISNITFLLQKGAPTDGIASAVSSAHEQIVSLTGVLNDLAAFLEVGSTDAEVTKEDVSIGSVVEKLQKEFDPQAHAQHLYLRCITQKDVPKTVHTNEVDLVQILSKLISNAIKYTHEGGVELRVSSDDAGINFAVKDTGIGISQSDQKRVFEKFFRSEDFRTRETGGTGLGLYIAEQMAMKIGAELTVESEVDKGSTFTLRIMY